MAKIETVMEPDVVTVEESETLGNVARLMRERDVGDVIVMGGDGKIRGIVTDRDLVIRGVADGLSVEQEQVSKICSRDLATVSPDADVEDVVILMRDRAVRRVPVTQDEKVVGIVSLGSLAARLDPRSLLGHISNAAPNR